MVSPMRILLTIVSLILLPLTLRAQEEELPADELAFDEIMEVYYDDEFDSAIVLFQNFLINHPSSSLVPRVKYNIGYLLVELEREEESIPIFEEILRSDFNEKERFGGLMEQYALYKHRSSSFLADIYLGRGEFELAKKYIYLFDKKHKYQHFCGNEMMANKIYTARQYARLYNGQGKTDKAIKRLLPFLFYNGLASNDRLLELLDELLAQRYSEIELKQIIDQARSSLYTKKGKTMIEFLDTKIQVHSDQLYAIGNLEMQANLELKGDEKWAKVMDTHPILGKK